jgi:hypothetical protein
MVARFRAKRLASDLDLISSSGSLPVQPAISGLGQERNFINDRSEAVWCDYGASGDCQRCLIGHHHIRAIARIAERTQLKDSARRAGSGN